MKILYIRIYYHRPRPVIQLQIYSNICTSVVYMYIVRNL